MQEFILILLLIFQTPQGEIRKYEVITNPNRIEECINPARDVSLYSASNEYFNIEAQCIIVSKNK
jgi:hypothetical protein